MEDKIIEIIEELGRIPLVISHETLTEYLTEDEIDDLSIEDLIFVEIDEKTISCTVKEDDLTYQFEYISALSKILSNHLA